MGSRIPVRSYDKNATHLPEDVILSLRRVSAARGAAQDDVNSDQRLLGMYAIQVLWLKKVL